MLAVRERQGRGKQGGGIQKHDKQDGERHPDARPEKLDAQQLRQMMLEFGADDVGFVSIDHDEIAEQREEIRNHYPFTRTLVSLVCRMNREPIRSVARSAANLEFHSAGDQVNHVGRSAVTELENQGIRAVNPSMGFPMEMDRFPGKVWIVSHKPVAVAAGLGRMGIHRNVIHTKFGNFILLGTLLIDREVQEHSEPIDYDPCLECKLCVAACPVGAIAADGGFDFGAYYTHNYREIMGGFSDWVENVADCRTWIRFLRREVTLARALLTLKIRLKGSPIWLLKFGRCFPS